MCWTEKFCYCVPLDIACVIIGLCGIILSAIMTLASIVLLMIEQYPHPDIIKGRHYLQGILHVDLKEISIEVVLAFMMIIGFLWMLFSVLLLVGVRKNKPSFVLAYFSYGILLTIICLLSALLLLLEKNWIAALVMTILSLFYIHCLVAIHTVYDLMLRGKHFGTVGHTILEDEASMITTVEDWQQ